MQFKPCTGYRFLFKLFAGRSNVVQPSGTANTLNVADERIPRLDHRELVSLVVIVVPSMYEKYIDVVIILNAVVSRTDIKTMDLY